MGSIQRHCRRMHIGRSSGLPGRSETALVAAAWLV